MSTRLNAPAKWFYDDIQDLPYNYRSSIQRGLDNIRFMDAVYSEIEPDHIEAIERILQGADNGYNYKYCTLKVQRVDRVTVSVEYVDDDPEDSKDPRVDLKDYALGNFQDQLSIMLGSHWRIERAPDEREFDDTSDVRALIRRVAARNFRYSDEEYVEAWGKMYAHVNPTDDAVMWADLLGDLVNGPGLNEPLIAESTTGTQHLARRGDLRNPIGGGRAETECGRRLNPYMIEDGRTRPYRDILHDYLHSRVGYTGGPLDLFAQESEISVIPGDVLTDPCKSCTNHYDMDVAREHLLMLVREAQE